MPQIIVSKPKFSSIHVKNHKYFLKSCTHYLNKRYLIFHILTSADTDKRENTDAPIYKKKGWVSIFHQMQIYPYFSIFFKGASLILLWYHCNLAMPEWTSSLLMPESNWVG